MTISNDYNLCCQSHWLIAADALTKIDGKYPYGKMKFIKETCLAALVILILGIGFFLADFGTDLQFSIEMSAMSNQNFTEDINNCTRDVQVIEVTRGKFD